MIIQPKGSKEQTSLMDLLGGSSKTADSKSNGMFSRLLASLGAQAKPGAAQIVSSDFKAVVDPRKAVVQAADVPKAGMGELQALLKGSGETEEDAFISAELLDTLSKDQVRTLIHQAKEYLKNEIIAKAPEYLKESEALPKSLMGLVHQTDVGDEGRFETLPKSLMGLVHLADKLGLEPQSITLSALITDSAEESGFSSELLSRPLLDPKILTQLPVPAQMGDTAETLMQLLGEIKTKREINSKESADPQQEEQPLKALLRQNLLPKTDSETQKSQQDDHLPQKDDYLPQKTAHPSEGAVKANIQHTAPSAEEKKNTEEKPSAAVSTQPAPKTEVLMALLQGESEPSAAATDENGNLKTDTEASKIVQTPKADSLEVKSKEAQQSMRYFASDLKEAVENYKPPFTRLTMKLNPEQLGEVEVTLVQRGNNVHVNIQSNNATSIAFLAHNASELKAQLAHQGITNATMNFMSGGEGQQQNPQHQQQPNRFHTYPSLAELELNEEQLGALEIIIPHYA